MKRQVFFLIVLLVMLAQVLSPLPSLAVEERLEVEWLMVTNSDGYSGASYSEILNIDREGNVYAANDDGWLYCYTPGQVMKWKANIYQPVAHGVKNGVGPALDSEGNCYIASNNKKVYKINKNGIVLNEFLMEESVAGATSPVLDEDGTLYVVTKSHVLYALNSSNLTEKWRCRVTGYSGCLTPVLGEDTVYVGSNTCITALDKNPQSGQRTIWTYELEEGEYLYQADTGGTISTENRIMADREENLYFMTQIDGVEHNRLLALNSDERSILWSEDINREVSGLALGEDTLYYKTGDNTLHARSMAEGSIKWDLPITGEMTVFHDRAPVVAFDGTVYASFGHKVYAFRDMGNEAQLLDACSLQGPAWAVSRPGPGGYIYVLQGKHKNSNNCVVLYKIKDKQFQQAPVRLIIPEDEKDILMLAGASYKPALELYDIYDQSMNTSGLVLTSDSPQIVGIDNGTIQALQTGQAEITITHPENEEILETLKIKVLEGPAAAELVLTPAEPQVTLEGVVQLKAVLRLVESQEVIKGEQLEWLSNYLVIASVDDDGTVKGKGLGQAKVTARLQRYPQVKAEAVVTVVQPEIERVELTKIQEKIAKTVDWYKDRGAPGQDWVALGLNAVNEDLDTYTDSYGKTYLEILEGKINKDPGLLSLMTDYERTVIGVVSAGGHPRNFAGMDLLEEIYNYPSLSQGVNCAIWGLIALDAANATVPAEAKHTRESLIQYILDNRVGDGWCFGGAAPDVDMTGMALYALAPYRERPAVKTAGEKAIQWLSSQQHEEGMMSSWGSINSESCSQAIMGVTAWGIDPQGADFTKLKGNLVTGLLSFYCEDGMFKHIDMPDPAFGTPQGLEALAALQDFYENGTSTIFYKITSKVSGSKIVTLEIAPQGIEIEANKVVSLIAKDQLGRVVDAEDVNWEVEYTDVAEIDTAGTLITKAPGETNIVVSLKNSDPLVEDTELLVVVGQDFEIEQIANNIPGTEAGDIKSLSFRIKNIADKEKPALFIMNVYDAVTDRLIYSSYLRRDFQPGEIHSLSGGYALPESGKYLVKIMFWNTWEKMRPLQEAVGE